MAPFRPALPRILVKGPSLFTVALRSTAVGRRCPEIILVGFLSSAQQAAEEPDVQPQGNCHWSRHRS